MGFSSERVQIGPSSRADGSISVSGHNRQSVGNQAAISAIIRRRSSANPSVRRRRLPTSDDPHSLPAPTPSHRDKGRRTLGEFDSHIRDILRQ